MPCSSRICLLPQIQLTRCTFTGAAHHSPSHFMCSAIWAGRTSAQPFSSATAPISARPVSSYHSWIAGPFSCTAVGALPDRTRARRAVIAASPPPPATGMSVQVPPSAANCSCRTATERASPPEVHQCSTSACGLASTGPAIITAVEAARTVFSFMDPPRSFSAGTLALPDAKDAKQAAIRAMHGGHARGRFQDTSLQTVTKPATTLL